MFLVLKAYIFPESENKETKIQRLNIKKIAKTRINKEIKRYIRPPKKEKM